MGIKLNWDSQADQNLDGLEIYRGSSPIDSANPGTPIATVAGNLTEYEDNTVTNKSVYYYRIAGKKGSERAWGENISAAYFSETGPGRKYPLRGDWVSGLMDILSPSDFISAADIITKVPALSSFPRGTPTQWYKMAYKGKILFIPNTYIVSASWNELYGAGVMFGEAGNGQIPAGVPNPPTAQRKVININGLDYILRTPKLSNLPYTQYLATQSDTIGSEWRSTGARLSRMSLEPQDGALPRLYDNAASVAVIGPHLASAGNTATHANNLPGALVTNGGFTARVSTVLLLELIMP